MKRNEQIQIITSAYELEVIQKTFTDTLRWTEHYIENSDYPSNWQRQTEPIKRRDLDGQPVEIKGFMETALLGLDGMVKNREQSIIENLQEQFYSWLAKSGISVDHCSGELMECLINIYKVLNDEGKEFSERVGVEAVQDIARMTPEERRQNFYNNLTITQRMMEVARARQKELEGKTHRDVGVRNQFSGNHDQGREILDQIKNRRKNRQIRNPNYREFVDDESEEFLDLAQWEFKEVVGYNDNGQKNLGEVLVRKNTPLNLDETGYPLFDSKIMLQRQQFSEEVWTEIKKQIQEISQQTSHQTQTSRKDNTPRGGGKGGGFGNPLIWSSTVVVSLIGLAFAR